MKIDADRGGSPGTDPRPEGAAVSRDAWHMVETGATLTLARRLPPRFDVMAEGRFPALHRRTLAHEVRKDVWRCLSRLRGFSPAVDRLGRSVSIPATEVMKGDAADQQALSRFSPAVLGKLHCVVSPTRPSSCRSAPCDASRG